MVTVQARLTTIAQEEGNHRLTRVGEDVERLVTELRDLAMTVRMVPIGTLFTRLQRSVHDTAQQLGKEVELRVDGGETELDKRVVDQLGDPLLHILRNAIDHGIEEPTERRESGKDLRGTIELTSGHSDGFVTVDITDDGAGLDAEKLIARARDKGIVSAGTELSPQEAYQLIFRPGFSTAQEVTDLSGRGVGMDVVQQTIQGLGGSVMVYSEPGLGTRFSLRVPLTLAIIEGLLLRVGEQYYVAPLAAVDECLELPQEQRQEGKHTMHVRDEMLPYLDLRELFRINGEAPSIQQVVVSRVNEARVGFVVDEVLGQLQTVIKSLGSIQRSTEGISGATILGNGGVALILDMPKLAGTRTGGTRAGGGAGASVRADDGTS
jgi:two-component system chemotaxis sensor kinase CheA